VKILAAGISHKTAPVELRELLAVKHDFSAVKLSLNVLERRPGDLSARRIVPQ